MALQPLRIVRYPDPFLSRRAREVTEEELRSGKADGLDLRELAERMEATMYKEEGVGLAAPQVRVGLRLWVADVFKDRDTLVAVWNPVLHDLSGSVVDEEGCLSLPEVRAKVKRAERVRLTALDVDGKPIEMDLEGLPARVAQHETDHLDGTLFIRHIGPAARFMLRNKLRALEEEYEIFTRRRRRA